MENSKKKELIKEKYNRTSFIYDKRYKDIQYEKYAKVIQVNDLANKMILDAGCGTGIILDYIQEKFDSIFDTNFHYIGVDISIKMLNQFGHKMENLRRKKLRYTKYLNLLLADLENLPFRNKKFNLLLSMTSYQNLPKIKEGIKESLRILRENAMIIISILKKNLDVDKLIDFLKKCIEINTILDKDRIEDIIIEGRKSVLKP